MSRARPRCPRLREIVSGHLGVLAAGHVVFQCVCPQCFMCASPCAALPRGVASGWWSLVFGAAAQNGGVYFGLSRVWRGNGQSPPHRFEGGQQLLITHRCCLTLLLPSPTLTHPSCPCTALQSYSALAPCRHDTPQHATSPCARNKHRALACRYYLPALPATSPSTIHPASPHNQTPSHSASKHTPDHC